MKNNNIKLKIIGCIGVAVLVCGFVFSAVPKKGTVDPLPDVPKTTSTGVSPSANEQNTPPQAVNSRVDDLSKRAPKQAAITSQTKTEYMYRALLSSNDPLTTNSWALQKTNTPAAWDVSTGSTETTVAVIDTGFALAHEDLTGSWKVSSGETGTTSSGDICWNGTPQNKQSNNCDDDENGYVDDWRGWNFSGVNNNPQAGQVTPGGSSAAHGTSVAGLVGAKGNNGKGIATLSWNTKVLPLQALSDTGVGYTSDVSAAVYYAVDNGADVINMSLGGDQFDQVLDTAIQYAYQHNVVVIAAAGNCGTGNESGCNPSAPGQVSYPAIENHVISVGATNQSDQRASFSSYGDGLDIMAPGSGTIVSPTWNQSNQASAYASSLSGTSFAAPQVSSLVALIKAVRPDSSVDDITALVLGTGTKVVSMNGQYFTTQYGHGLINASTALTVATSLSATSPGSISLEQTGSSVGEHLFSVDPLGSACQAGSNTYCTIWIKNLRTGFDRYLPYSTTSSSGLSGWTWSGASLTKDEWNVRARQGDVVSDTPYYLFRKW